MSSATDRAARPAAPIGRSRSIAVYLFVLALVALVPSFIFSAVLLQRNNEAQERVVDALITGAARSLMQAVDREITANVTTLRVLATTPTLLNENFEAFHTQTKAALQGSSSFIYVLDSNFYSVLSTRTDFGSPPVLSNDIASAKLALDTKEIVVSDLVVGKVSQRWVYNILLPVFPTGHQPLLIGFSRDAGDLATVTLADKLPDGWNVALVDSKGTVIAGSPAAGIPGTHFALADIAGHATTPGLVTVTSGDRTYRAAIRQSLLSDWSLITWAPEGVMAKPLLDAVWSLAVGGLLLGAIMVLVVYWVTLQIGRSVRGLETDAKRLGAGQKVVAHDYPITEIATISIALEEASIRRQAAETEVRFLMRELAHRSKNQMTVISAMAKQTARSTDSVPEFVQSFEKRIFGLARSTDLLLANGAVGVDLRELVSRQVDPFCPIDSGRVSISGPALRLNTQAAQILGMAAHELATNAVKYGAFLTDTGRLDVAWTLESGRVAFDWRETVPSLAPPGERRGFGTTVLESMVGRSLGATVERILHADGIEWRFEIDAAALDPAAVPQEADPAV